MKKPHSRNAGDVARVGLLYRPGQSLATGTPPTGGAPPPIARDGKFWRWEPRSPKSRQTDERDPSSDVARKVRNQPRRHLVRGRV
jgi:hypothetical protein